MPGSRPVLLAISTLLPCLCILALGGFAAAQESLFDPEPVLETSAHYGIVTFGDVDGDGRGDLLTSVFDGRQFATVVSLLPGTGGASPLASDPVWGPLPLDHVELHCAAFGDVDADGDLDLVLGGGGFDYGPEEPTPIRKTWLLRNVGGTYGALTDAPVVGDQVNLTAMILVDLDQDGDLDMVRGNGYPVTLQMDPERLPDPDRIYLYDADLGAYESGPFWTSATRYETRSILAGDLDRDGDIDLLISAGSMGVLVGGGQEPLSLFLNRRDEGSSTLFDAEPTAELLAPELPVLSPECCLGDLDGDGDLDLALTQDYWCSFHPNRFAPEGLATIIDEAPLWSVQNYATTVAAGDLDGDGDLDLVCGTWLGEDGEIYLNNGTDAPFATAPSSTFEPGLASYRIRLLDADGDGDLDLLSESTLGERLYRNLSPRLEPSARTTLVQADATKAIALADVNGDDHPDLICGNDGYTRLHLGLPTVFPQQLFSPAAAWILPFRAQQTWAVALGDVDGDGRPDLVLGNRDEENLLYLGTGTGFGNYPAWSSPGPQRYTVALTLGDVDGDGDLDLVCGNLNQPDQLFLNRGGMLADVVAWTSAASLATRAVALGDVDGDGRPDLACGVDGGHTAVYRNTDGTFTSTTVWQTDTTQRTRAVSLGDVNGDGRLDLACGNLGQRNRLYLNLDGELVGFPFWQSAESDSTTSIAFADVDADGWLDLVCGGPGRATCWYQNLGGRLAETATWRADQVRATSAVALADLDGDGDLDLVCGNDGQAPTLHLGRRNPIYPNDLTNPTYQTANIPVHIRDVAVTHPGRNSYRIAFTVADAESDPAWLRLQWRYADESGWQPALGGEVQGPFATTPAGTRHELDWDVTLLDIQRRPVVLELVSIEMPMSNAAIRQRTAYDRALGTVEILRPEVQADTAATFAAVTLGDTVSTTLTLRSTGNEPLQVAGITLPSAEMWLEGAEAFTVPVGQTAAVTVRLGPREFLQAAGDIVVQSDAPLTPALRIPVRAEILPLEVVTEALLEGDTAPLGEALTVQSIRQTRVEACVLHYRPTGAGGFTERPMERFGDSFRAVIPGQEVTERGLDYYVVMENSGVTATDPPGAPEAALHAVSVATPEGVTARPQPTSGADYLRGREIPVLVFLPDGALFEEGWLFLRRGGESDWDSIAVSAPDPLPTAVIPDSMVGARGVEYRLRVRTSTSTLTDPAISPATNPHVLRVRVTGLTEPTARVGERYAMVSLPLDFGADFDGTLASLLSGQPGYGPYDPLRWRCFRWQPAGQRYLELGGEEAPELHLQPSRSYWLISRDGGRVTTGPVPGWSVPTDGPFAITLEPGWSQVANPFDFAVSWAGVLVEGEPWASGAVSTPYVRTAGGYETGEDMVLEPFSGFWVLNEGTAAVTLGIPPVEARAALEGAKSEVSSGDDLTWSLAITASCAGLRDAGAVVAVAAVGAEGRDDLDRARPPAQPGRALWVCLPQDGEAGDRRSPRPLLWDVRDEAAGGWTWALDVAKTFAEDGLADEVTIRIEGAATLPAGLEAILVDTELGRTADLRREPGLSFNCGVRPATDDPGAARFRVVVGEADYVAAAAGMATPPAVTALLAPRPNPFNPASLLRYDLAAPQRIRLCLYDASGRLVATLVDGPHDAGRHEAVWRGEDRAGRRVAAGVYFARLETARDGAVTRKLTLLK